MPPCFRPSSEPVTVAQSVSSVHSSMAEWPSSADDGFRASFCDPTVTPMQSTPQQDSCSKEEQRELFDRALTTCLKELPQAQGKPLPVIISDGKAVDLYELSDTVKRRGGYDIVSSKKMWVKVAGDLGFGLECGPSLKLVYAKYLKEVDMWLHEISTPKCNEVNIFLQDKKRKREDGDYVYGTGLQDSPIVILDSKEESPILISDDKETSGIQDTSNGNRKYDSFSDLLKWIKRLVINPYGYIEQTAKFSRQSKEWAQEQQCFYQAMMARVVLFLPNQGCLSGEVLHTQKKQKVQPSLYEESNATNYQALDRLRATDKRLALYGSQHYSSVSPTFLPGNHTVGSSVSNVPTSSDPQWLQYNPRSSSDVFNGIAGSNSLYLERLPRKRIPIGSNHQADVPSWHGPQKHSGNGDFISVQVDLDESRWLGTQVWPPKGGKSVVNKERIGKGRPDGCLCFVPGSIECVRLHIRDAREKLKSELGSAFCTWRFNDMGEDASMSWTPEDERKFRALVRLNPISLGKNFWDQLPACFPSKSMEMLVSYYFNVFVLRRRTLQNRVKPEEIDSDDDESDFGSVENLNMDGDVLSGIRNAQQLSRGNYVGEASSGLICQQNMQDEDFDVLEERNGTLEATLRGGHNGRGIQNELGKSCSNHSVVQTGANQDGT